MKRTATAVWNGTGKEGSGNLSTQSTVLNKNQYSWISITLHEGKNRQVRKMTAAVGFPTLRLIRIAIEKLKLDGMQPGDVREIEYPL